ncbi:phytanoyl-CoA dioxygenase family protein [Mucilaginibacter agri]|nr:phytanoyl-CoA dioxygenase family protein [Mucilaginibacter agri]
MLKKEAKLDQGDFEDEWQTDATLLSTLGLGLEPTLKYLYHTSPSFDEFENWILATTPQPDLNKIFNFNKLFSKEYQSFGFESISYEVLSPEDLKFWEENGYVIIRNAVSREICDLTIEALCDHIEVDRYDASTWYKQHQSRQGIMVQLFQHPLLEQNRRSLKIRKAYEELWQRTDIWVNTDRVGFNPPQTASYKFPGPYLHWDMRTFTTPVPFGLQGILYLSDTAENQGAFTLVPGFQHKIDDWLVNLPKGVDPQKQDLYSLGAKPIAANAGDFIIWHHALPHGSRPNTAKLPRFVQYINYMPAN